MIWQNDTCGAQINGQANIPPRTVAFHPGQRGELSVVRWTCPASGTYEITAWFEARDRTTSDVSVRLNGARPELAWTKITPGNPSEFKRQLGLQSGDNVDFAVGFGDNGNFAYDSTGIQVVVTRL